jgi:hypothetical protein
MPATDTATVKAIAARIEAVYRHGPVADAAAALVALAAERDLLRRERDGLLALAGAGHPVAGPAAAPVLVS